MSYRIHKTERWGLAQKVADLLMGIPEEETQELLAEAQKLLLLREFGQEGLGRNGENNPYWFETMLISQANKAIAAGDPLRAWRGCLIESNHGHSGFVSQTHRVYMRPTNATEQKVSEDFRQMIIGVATAILNSNPLSKKIGFVGEAWLSVIAVCDCLWLLGADVPQELISQFKELIAGYERLDSKNPDLQRMKARTEHRFG